MFVGDVDDAHENVVASRDDAGLEEILEGEGDAYDGAEGQEHGEGLEGEQLELVLLHVPGVLDDGVQVHWWFPAAQPEEQPHYVASQRPVGVGVLRVDDADELREYDDVDEVGTQEPQLVDGRHGQGSC